MLRPSGRLGLALLLLAGFTAPAQKILAQTLPSPPAVASSPKATSSAPKATAHKSKASSRKAAPASEVPQTPPALPTLEQQPPSPPQVSYRDGQLTIDSQNATLSQVLRSVQMQTGASIDMPSGAGSERVVARLGPGKPKDVLASLLNGSKFNYVILGDANNSAGVQKIILLSKNSSTADNSAVTTAQNNNRAPSPTQAVEPPEDEYPPPDQETDNQNQPTPGQPGNEGMSQDVINIAPGQNAAGARTPEQMLQELQRMQQQQQQMQQQLNPANQQTTPFPSQPVPQAPQQ